MNPLLSRLTITGITTLLAVASANAQPPPAVVELGMVSQGNSSPVIRLPGSVLSIRDARIAAELSGRLTWVAEVGDRVEKGQPLAIIDSHLLGLQLRNDEAEIARIQADIDYNQRQQGRLRKLARQNNTARSELDQVESGLAMLNQELRIAEVNRDRTLYDLERSEVSAPFSGVIASREMSAGEYTAAGATLVRLVDTSALEISVGAPLRVARFNQPGSEAQIEADGYQFVGTIRGAVPVGDSRSRMMELRLDVEPDRLFIGEAVTVELSEGKAERVLSIPRDALVLRNEEVFVYTVSAENTAVKVPVTPGAGRGAEIAIQGELEIGAPVVIRGAERLRDGQPVKVIQHHLAAY
jgi:RND family efflux transporter MFP subunit